MAINDYYNNYSTTKTSLSTQVRSVAPAEYVEWFGEANTEPYKAMPTQGTSGSYAVDREYYGHGSFVDDYKMSLKTSKDSGYTTYRYVRNGYQAAYGTYSAGGTTHTFWLVADSVQLSPGAYLMYARGSSKSTAQICFHPVSLSFSRVDDLIVGVTVSDLKSSSYITYLGSSDRFAFAAAAGGGGGGYGRSSSYKGSGGGGGGGGAAIGYMYFDFHSTSIYRDNDAVITSLKNSAFDGFVINVGAGGLCSADKDNSPGGTGTDTIILNVNTMSQITLSGGTGGYRATNTSGHKARSGSGGGAVYYKNENDPGDDSWPLRLFEAQIFIGGDGGIGNGGSGTPTIPSAVSSITLHQMGYNLKRFGGTDPRGSGTEGRGGSNFLCTGRGQGGHGGASTAWSTSGEHGQDGVFMIWTLS